MELYIAYYGNILGQNPMKVIAVCTTRDVALHICKKHAADIFSPLSESDELNLDATGICGNYAINAIPSDTCF